MKQSKFLKLLFLSVLVLAVFSCTKTGPAGAAGATGATGPAGPKGDPGAAGSAGSDSSNANIQISQWIALTWYADPSGSAVSDTVSAPALTPLVLDSGFVLVYMKPDSTSTPFQLPYTQILNGSSAFVLQASVIDGGGGIYLQGSAPIGVPVGAADIYPTPLIKYIIVPSGTAIPNNISYEKVCKLLNIVN